MTNESMIRTSALWIVVVFLVSMNMNVAIVAEALPLSPPSVRSAYTPCFSLKTSLYISTSTSATTGKTKSTARSPSSVSSRCHRPLELRAFRNGGSDESDSKMTPGFQRDLSVSKVGFASYEYSSLRRRSTELDLWNKKKSDGDENDTEDGKANKIGSWFGKKKDLEAKKNQKAVPIKEINEDSVWYKFADKYENIKEDVAQKLDEVSQKILSVLPPQIVEFLTMVFAKIKNALPNLGIAFLSFSTGAVLMLAAILIPVYNSVENLSQPVTLFETILADLDAGYVDPVDTNKLFETGVSAMLKSLDPYTEFEAKEEAKQMNEGIMGRYGGVGLVISGATPRDLTEIKKITGGSDVASSSSSVNQLKQEAIPTGSKLLPNDAIQDSMDSSENNKDVDSSSQSSNTKNKKIEYPIC